MDHLQEASGIALASVDVKKLKDVGLCPVVSVAFPPTKDLLQTKGISEAHVDNTIEAASKLLSLRLITASQLLAQRIETSKLLPRKYSITSESREHDNISEGGNETRSTTQIYGDICSASTQSYRPLCGTCQRF